MKDTEILQVLINKLIEHYIKLLKENDDYKGRDKGNIL